MLYAWLAKQALHNHRPERPEWNGGCNFRSFVLMDDTILIEPMLGARPWMAMATAEQCTRNALGPKTLNEEKDLVEGRLEVEKLIWGLNYNTERGTRALPAVKLEKASHLLHLPEFDHGNTQIPLKLIQELRGNQQFWLAVIPSLGPCCRPPMTSSDPRMRKGLPEHVETPMARDGFGRGSGKRWRYSVSWWITEQCGRQDSRTLCLTL